MTDPADRPAPPTEPAPSFKWVVVVALAVWALSAAMYFISKF